MLYAKHFSNVIRLGCIDVKGSKPPAKYDVNLRVAIVLTTNTLREAERGATRRYRSGAKLERS